jgi:transposase-like protein
LGRRVPASRETSERIEELVKTLEGLREGPSFQQLGLRKLIEELLEAEVSERLGRGYYERGGEGGTGHRNGYRTGRLATAEGEVEYSVPQVRGLEEPFRSKAPSREVARMLRDVVVAEYEKRFPSAVKCFLEDFEACIAHLRFPIAHRRVIRTINLLERLFHEERRRMKIVANAFGERAVLKLIYAALIRASESWRGIQVKPFERRQLQAVGEELDAEYQRAHEPTAVKIEVASPSRKSSRDRT